ncbi:DUF1080 domain-containing protein [Panacibacter sp. DH6]|uniref:DUF1080 domain-containing protein n=1 Tax=Panacibacter microcysteis TaxID=2793269 RepID=A0A931MDE8_9BACT|nr:DUF1080 domain-containing protein [Panacibacter microcysteis]MBG9378338.1 DUF1080 domain-containing protein [Panacibacter microcysteis]
MKNYLLLLFVMALVTLTVNATPKDSAILNQLSKKEMAEGWKLLFDGKSLDGWRTFKNATGSSWQVVDGMLCSTKPQGHSNPDIITNDMFGDFELQIDWKISPKGNSGIMYMVTEDYDGAELSGPEYQLIDDDGFPEKLQDWQKTGANYAMNVPMVSAVKAPGEWNHTVIKVSKGHVEHWLNGKKVVEYDLYSDAWKKAKAEGKWKDAPGYGASKTGHIAFQASHSGVENTGVCFRNIKIKLL